MLASFLLTLYIIDRYADLWCCSKVGQLFVHFVHHRQAMSQKTCQMASTSVSKQTAVSSTFSVSSHAQKPLRNSSLSCCLLTIVPFSPTHGKPYKHIINCFSDADKIFGLTISLKKTEVLYQPPPCVAYNPHISIIGTNLKAAEHFTYLGSVISKDATVSRMMTTTCPKLAVPLEDCQREYGRVTCSTSPQKSRYMGPLSFTPSCMVQRPGFSIGSRSGYLSGFTNSTCTLSLASKARLRVERRSPQESQPAQHRVHLASGAVALGWSRHKDGRHTHAKSSLLQQAPRRKAQSWCSKKASQRPAEETACTGWNQPSVMTARGLRPRQLAFVSEKSQFVSSRQRGMKPQRKNEGGRKSEQHPYHLQPKSSSVQSAVGCAHQDSASTATNECARI